MFHQPPFPSSVSLSLSLSFSVSPIPSHPSSPLFYSFICFILPCCVVSPSIIRTHSSPSFHQPRPSAVWQLA
ncbi:hypothetical protein LX36DRAFT_234022 [Colletotrichum falcatum]|nr:hypothetical protein LX36DRAFT_234022 [Colletotrichum falcatum]